MLSALFMAFGDIIDVNDKMQAGYRYELVGPVGVDFRSDCTPVYSPRQMLEMGTGVQ